MDMANESAAIAAAELGLSLAPLIEQICRDLAHAVPRARVECVVLEVLQQCRGATVTAYLPLLVRRRACERLRCEAAATSERTHA
jgi:hypothetical protein